MTGSVVSIFKILVGTVVVIVLSSLIIEYLNMILMSTFLRGYITKTIEKSCDLFAQETYLGEGGGRAVNLQLSPIKFTEDTTVHINDDETAVDTDWFSVNNSLNSKTLYNSLYGKDNKEYMSFLTQVTRNSNIPSTGTYSNKVKVVAEQCTVKRPWVNLVRIKEYLDNQSGTSTNIRIGKTYYNQYVTPLNQGITYIDSTALTKITKWALVNNLSNGMRNQVIPSSAKLQNNQINHIYDYVEYSGYRVYFNTFMVTGITYHIYDLNVKKSREAFAIKTGVGYGNENYWNNELNITSLVNAQDTISRERRYVCVADIDYTMTVAYDGVTPLKRVINFMNNRVVEGAASMNGVDYRPTASNQTDKTVNGSYLITNDMINQGYNTNQFMKMSNASNYQLADFNAMVTYYIVR